MSHHEANPDRFPLGLPLKASADGNDIENAAGAGVCAMYADERGEQYRDLIVKAVNSHDALVEACKGVAIMLNTELADYDSEPWAQRVRAAIARAEAV